MTDWSQTIDPPDTYAILLSVFRACGVSFPVFNLLLCKLQLTIKHVKNHNQLATMVILLSYFIC